MFLQVLIILVARCCTLFSFSISFFKKGLQTCTQNSNLGLTSALYNLTIISLFLLVIVRLIIPNVALALLTTLLQSSANFILESTITPKSLSALLAFNKLCSSSHLCSALFLPICRTDHFQF